MQLTKTDFIQYLNCPKSLWLLKHEPESYPSGTFSVFVQKLAREGYEVERYVRQLLSSDGTRTVNFQAVFETEDGLFARLDALERNGDGGAILYEIKSSTSVKTGGAHNHIKDAGFQKICAERAGQKIDRVVLVHLNGGYVRNGDVDPAGLLSFVDVTPQVDAIAEETEEEIDAALEFLRQAAIERGSCSCLNKSRANHCDTFGYFNPDVPSPSIYSLPNLSAGKRSDLVVKGIFDLQQLPRDLELTPTQELVVRSARMGAPQINADAIRSFLAGLEFPLYFLDYETYASAVPRLNRTSPHRHFPVQYSLHVLDADGTLRHEEFLEREARLPDRLIAHMRERIGPVGNLISWHASFEKAQNDEMGRLFPDWASFFASLNTRMVDLEVPFKTSYVDVRFDGSTSIKKVLPVVCPTLSYDDLEVKDGASAMEAWERLIVAERQEADHIAASMYLYCERDTLAMVEIYRFLDSLL